MRDDGRNDDALRPIRLTTGYQKGADGSVLVEWGDTWVLCSASIEEKVPPFRQDTGGGWVTAEYNMLPASTRPRKTRRIGGREQEIQRLIGRSLRTAVDLSGLGPRTITIDCDVLQADGGTRVASITGGYVALALACAALQRSEQIAVDPRVCAVASVSVGVLDDRPLLDLCYAEDRRVDVDMNVVMTDGGQLVEIQGTAEQHTFSREQLNGLCDLAWHGIDRLCALQQRALEAARQQPHSSVEIGRTDR